MATPDSGTTRACRRNGCDAPAAVSLAFHYDAAQVWLVDLVQEEHPLRWELCAGHVGTLRVPRGWVLIDHRDPASTVPRPGGSSDTAAATSREPGRAPLAAVPSPPQAAPDPPNRESRYAELHRELPRLAARYASTASRDIDLTRDIAPLSTEPPSPPPRDSGPDTGEEPGGNAP
ncbi:DUF3499 family protein [Egibacter rhizosphaerae]|nr:DUF3499 family protein [Egibacter rhizosphaerae]